MALYSPHIIVILEKLIRPLPCSASIHRIEGNNRLHPMEVRRHRSHPEVLETQPASPRPDSRPSIKKDPLHTNQALFIDGLIILWIKALLRFYDSSKVSLFIMALPTIHSAPAMTFEKRKTPWNNLAVGACMNVFQGEHAGT